MVLLQLPSKFTGNPKKVPNPAAVAPRLRPDSLLEVRMFDAETPESGLGSAPESETESAERRQYTIKGIEADTIDLMRGAARKDGMKIGAWISARMKEAAFRSLGTTKSEELCAVGRQSESIALSTSVSFADVLYKLDRRLQKIENEMNEITKVQRTIMAKMLQDA